MPNQGNGNDGMSHIGGQVPANHHEAMYQYAKWRDDQLPRDEKVHIATCLREAVAQYLKDEFREKNVPEELLDILDEDLEANAGGQKGGA